MKAIIAVVVVVAAVITGYVLMQGSYAPSLPQQDGTWKTDSITNAQIFIANGCVIGGCNGEVCTEEEKSGPSACVALPEFFCYHQKNTRCEQQATGKCGWTQTPQLKSCLAEKSANH